MAKKGTVSGGSVKHAAARLYGLYKRSNSAKIAVYSVRNVKRGSGIGLLGRRPAGRFLLPAKPARLYQIAVNGGLRRQAEPASHVADARPRRRLRRQAFVGTRRPPAGSGPARPRALFSMVFYSFLFAPHLKSVCKL